ncbi:YkgJ family cysteine cluster protein [Desulfurobacterium sp. TC5-1]|uniref:YkgJ family cysteine cluster protein n=1 Tax=Desulfurobacterium sp. TC5-1 TaxID=1158318 RepID=UPI0003B33BD3|nr:YkgJ family cysteine cluster protein [Desulfurobacterium sp. TC5-1]
MPFRCDPEKCKALCCKYDGNCLFTLELFIGEMKLFSPENTIFLLTLMGSAKTKKERTKGYSNAFINIREVFNSTHLPNISLLFVVQSLIVEEKCPHLKDNRCSIYLKRPFICAVYPFLNSEPEAVDALQRVDFKSFQESTFKKCKECCSLGEEKFKGFNEFFRKQKKVLRKYGRKYNNVLREHRNFLLRLFRENKSSFKDYIRYKPPINS